MSRYIANKDSHARDVEERRDYRSITRNKYGKDEQHEMVRPIFGYLKRRFSSIIGEPYLDAVSLRTRQPYNMVQKILSNNTGSPSFYDVMRLAEAAGTSLDYLASLVALDLYDLERYDVRNITDPGHLYFLSDEEVEVMERLRSLPEDARHALVERFASTPPVTPTAPTTPRPTKTQRQPRTPVSSGPVSE